MYGSREFFASDTLARFIARAVHTLTLDRPPASSFAHIEIMGFCDPGTLGRECSFPAIAIICERNEQFKKPAIRLTAISIHKSACSILCSWDSEQFGQPFSDASKRWNDAHRFLGHPVHTIGCICVALEKIPRGRVSGIVEWDWLAARPTLFRNKERPARFLFSLFPGPFVGEFGEPRAG